MNTIRFHCQTTATIGLALLCSCATRPRDAAVVPACHLPAEVTMNKGAGKGMFLLVKLRLETGEEFACVVDTGAPGTHLPRSLESRLGKRLGTRKFTTLDSGKFAEHIYVAPKLYLGDVPLVTGSHIGTSEDWAVLGMDCLRHYCIQLDFKAGKMRFLDPERVNAAEQGKAYSLTGFHHAMIDHPGLFGREDSKLFIDTGCAMDGYVRSGVFDRAVREQHAQTLPVSGGGVGKGKAPEFVLFPECVWDGETYTDLIVGKGQDLIGLRFLARHLVTFNFPKRVMYLKRTNGYALSQERSQNESHRMVPDACLVGTNSWK